MDRIKKRVVIFCLNRSGLFQYATQLTQALSTDGWDVLFVTSKDNPQFLISEKITILKVSAPHFVFKFCKQTLKHLFEIQMIWRKILDFDPVVFHVIDGYPWYLLWFFYFKKRPLVTTIHDPLPHKGETQGLILRLMTRYLLSISKRVVVHGEILKKTLCVNYTICKEMVGVIPHGNYNFFRQWSSGLPVKKGTILFFGRVLHYKGLKYLISAVQNLIDGGYDISLIIAGEGDVSDYRKMIKPELLSRFIFINKYIEESEVANLFDSAHLVALPYLEATQSGVIPIAFSFAKPTIVTNVGALPEVVINGINGVVIPPKEVESLEGAIKLIIEDEEFSKKISLNAAKSAQDTLSWRRIAELYGEEYKKALS